MSELKRRIIDMLFEPEGEDVIEEAPLTDLKKEKKKEVRSVPAPPANKDVLSKPAVVKQSVPQRKTSSAFINLNDDSPSAPGYVPVHTKTEQPVKKEEKAYEAQPTISPIFGVIENREEPKTENIEVDSSQTKKPNDSRLGTVISPIYGYSTKEIPVSNPFFAPRGEEMIEDEIEYAEEENQVGISELDDEELSYLFSNEQGGFENHSLDELLNGSAEMTDEEEIDLFSDFYKD